MAERVEAVRPEDSGTPPQLSEAPSESHAAAPTRRKLQLDTFRSLRHRDYRLLWLGTVSGSSAQWIEQVTISWLTYDLTGSAYLLGLVNGARSLPHLLFGPFTGVAADRSERKRSILLPSCATLNAVGDGSCSSVVWSALRTTRSLVLGSSRGSPDAAGLARQEPGTFVRVRPTPALDERQRPGRGWSGAATAPDCQG